MWVYKNQDKNVQEWEKCITFDKSAQNDQKYNLLK